MTIANPEIQAKADAVAAARTAKAGKARVAASADVKDLLEALTALKVPFNGNGVCVKPDGALFLMGAPSNLAAVQTSVQNAIAWDDAEVAALTANLTAALEAAAR